MKFNFDNLSQDDLNDLNDSMKKAGPRIRFIYHLQSARSSSIFPEDIIEQTLAVSDFNKHEYSFLPHESGKSYLDEFSCSKSDRQNKGLVNLMGFKDWDLKVYNPENPLKYLPIWKNRAKLELMYTIGWGNTHEAIVNFGKKIAVIPEEDQDIAHRLGLMFTPASVLEIDSLKPSDPEMNRDRERKNGLEIYCDNRACMKEIRNPWLVVEDETGGAYHSDICCCKDIMMKNHRQVLDYSPRVVSLDEAKEMFGNGSLQQSGNYTQRSVKINQSKI